MKAKTLEERLAQLNAAAQTEGAPAPAPEEPEEKKVAQEEEKEEQAQTEDQNSSLLAELDRRCTELENKLSALSESVLSAEEPEPEHQAPPPNNVGEEKAANEISELKQMVAKLTAQIAVQGAEAEPVSTSPTLQAPREELSGLELASSALRKQLVSQGLIKD